MNNKYDTYFPERFVKNRFFATKAIKTFINRDFDNYADAYHELRAFIRQPVSEWHVGAYLSNELLDERDLIREELDSKYSFILENPTEESRKEFRRQNEEMMSSEVWQRWQNWLKKTRGLIKNYPRLEEETEATKSIIEFNKSGRNIFSLAPFLIQLLNHTDIGNISFTDIKLPFNSIYLHFGALADIEYPIDLFEHKHGIEYKLQAEDINYYLDGAFVSMLNSHSLDIRLTFIDTRIDFNKKVPITKDYRFPTINFTLDFGKWDSETSEFNYDKDVTFNNATVCFYDIWDSNTNPGEIEYEKMHLLTKQPEKCNHGEWQEYVIFDKALMMIVNALCYLNFVKDDIEISTTNDQATQLVLELSKTQKHQQRNKIIEKLKRISYSKIHLFGRKIENEFKSANSGIEVEPHWRRGHWRNQPFGIGLTSTKLIWIKPTIVRKDKGEPTIGHIYEV